MSENSTTSSIFNLLNITDNKSIENKKSSIRLKKLPISIIDSLVGQQKQTIEKEVVENSDIIIPVSLQQIKTEQFIGNIQEINLTNKLRKKTKLKDIDVQQIKNDNVEVQELNQLVANKELIETYQQLTKQEIPEEVDFVKIVEELKEASESIPGAEDLSLNDFVIEEKVKGSGWFKTKVTIKSELASNELSQIATIVKSSTNNIVIHRAMDFRTISNSNKNQLKDSNFKLYPISYVFRPIAGKEIKASKYARFAISIPNEFNSTNRILIFMQEGNKKYVNEINLDIEFLSKVISDFYIVGFDVTKARLNSNGVDNPLNVFINKLTLSRKYLVNPIQNDNGEINQIIIKTKNGKHQWLGITVTKSNLIGTYQLKAISKPDPHWQFGINSDKNSPITIDTLMSEKFFNKLDELFNTFDWAKFGMGEDDLENRQYYLMSKITYRALKTAFIEIYNLEVDNPELGIFIKEVLSQKDTVNDIDAKYAAEIVIGKTNYIDYFILSWSAVQQIGGNERIGKTGNNYNSRPYMFTLQYSIGGKQKSLNSKDFEELKDLSGFLTPNPK